MPSLSSFALLAALLADGHDARGDYEGRPGAKDGFEGVHWKTTQSDRKSVV